MAATVIGHFERMTSPTTTANTTLKLLLMGDSGVGKSSILLRFVEDKFLGEDVHAATIGVDFKVKHVDLADGQRVKLTIWDTAGQERFRTLTSSYYRGAHGVILVYDVTNRESFEDVKGVWMKELDTYAKVDEMILMVVANKIDKTEERRVVRREEGEELAKSLSALYMESSAKTKVGVMAAFTELVQAIMHSPRIQEARKEARDRSTVKQLSASGDTAPSTGCSC